MAGIDGRDRRRARLASRAAGERTLESETPADPAPGMRALWMEPEGPHSVENIDEHRFHAIRVELK